ncbi:DUF3842 family protein [Vallitalea guaymasensis]|uniref:DUF3842 family protein n=1 Tax=Vallitalea guaymasensis TaxID=1185412 RepID=A0A8J8SAK1_9FIRM|nr:DUF3842 family protein [Vallitalea guaymasensis]QUH27818.1 DUF3842 family protein [Vallitalea guaymasensis]
MKIAVVDGQGGGIGKIIIDKLKNNIDETHELIALGTNSTATTGMIKAGANSGATGENAIKVMSKRVDIILGPLAIMVPDAMMGEITTEIALSISSSEAKKILLPFNKCNMVIAGVQGKKLNKLIEELVQEVLRYI